MQTIVQWAVFQISYRSFYLKSRENGSISRKAKGFRRGGGGAREAEIGDKARAGE